MNSDLIGHAKQRHRLADLASRTGISLTTTAGTVTVRCPLPSHGHPDRTPSMRLYLDDGHYYCFGCGARGDVIQWVRDAQGTGVMDAIRHLDSGASIANAWAGVPTESRWSGPSASGDAARTAELPHPERTSAERVRAALQEGWEYYTFRRHHDRGAAYLARRGIDIAVLESHTRRAEVGHTPDRSDGLVPAMRACGFSNDELVDAGLAYRRSGDSTATDFFRERVLIPIRAADGSICGLIGRNVGDPRWPKYKNPPHTHAYDKSVNLYQPLPAPQRRGGRVIVVEGTLDALAIAVSAIRRGRTHHFCPITQSGKELSGSQIETAFRLHPGPLLISFDGDAAGRDSNRRLAAAIRSRGRTASVIDLPDGTDPASWLTRFGPAALDRWGVPTPELPPSVSSDGGMAVVTAL